MDQKTIDLIDRIRSVREEKGLSYQDIYDICEKNGEPVSMSTIRRVFNSDCESIGFRYDTTLQPIVRAVLGLGMEVFEEPGESQEIAALKTVIELKDDVIVKMGETISSKNEEIDRLMLSARRQIDSREEAVVYLKDLIRRQRVYVLADRILCIVLLVLIIIVLVVDKINPGIGLFRG